MSFNLKLATLTIACIVGLNSCIDKEKFNLDNNTLYHPEFSIPLGKTEFLMEDYEDVLGGFIQIQDTIIPTDTTAFFYENEFYQLPGVITTRHKEPFSLNMSEDNSDYIKSLMFRTNVLNEIPTEMSLQIYFVNINEDTIASLFDEPLEIEAAIVNGEGEIIEIAKEREDTFFDEYEIDDIIETKWIIIETNVYLCNNPDGFTNFYSYQTLTVQLGARIGIEINTNE